MVPKFSVKPIIIIEQGGIAEAAFDTVIGMIDSIAKLTCIPACRKTLRAGKPNRYFDFRHYKTYVNYTKSL